MLQLCRPSRCDVCALTHRHVQALRQESDSRALVLLDEVGTGTDPVEGAALGAAILQALARGGARGAALTLATTHHRQAHASIGIHRCHVCGCLLACCQCRRWHTAELVLLHPRRPPRNAGMLLSVCLSVAACLLPVHALARGGARGAASLWPPRTTGKHVLTHPPELCVYWLAEDSRLS